MKRVGILTFFYEHNYGAVLQCLALFRCLKSKSLDVEAIHYVTKRAINDDLKLVNMKKGNVIKQMITAPLNRKKYRKFKEFIRENLEVSRRIDDDPDFREYASSMDAIVCGSDQVWNEQLTKEDYEVFLLDGVDTKRFAYAASFGKSQVSDRFRESLQTVLSAYSMIGVREDSGVEIVRDCGFDSELVMDPTLLLDGETWGDYAKNVDISEEFVLVYAMEKNDVLNKIAVDVAKKLGLKIVHFRKEKIFKDEMRVYDAGPSEFLWLFRNARYVVTNSFHGVVFSILNNKDFISVSHRERNTRQESLLGLLNLRDRIVNSFDEYNMVRDQSIDYGSVNKLLEANREKSLDFLNRIVEVVNDKN